MEQASSGEEGERGGGNSIHCGWCLLGKDRFLQGRRNTSMAGKAGQGRAGQGRERQMLTLNGPFFGCCCVGGRGVGNRLRGSGRSLSLSLSQSNR
jgi:hypothetical protein